VGHDILVDGYNIIKCAPSFQAARLQSLAAARTQLVALLNNRYRHTPHQVIVVFDGDADREQTISERRIRVIYSRHGETADSVLARLAAEARVAGREIEIYSDDSEVQQTARLQGGTASTTIQLEQQVHAAPRDVAKRIRYRVALRRKYGLDSNRFTEVDNDELSRPPGKKKKKHR
jgi:predicted RNA-binding protein with PIN domain